MAFSFTDEQFARIGDSARLLEAESTSRERQMDSLLSTAETDLQISLGVIGRPRDAAPSSLVDLTAALRVQLHRSRDAVATARQLCLAARQTRLTANRLLSALGGATEQGALRAAARPGVLVVDDHDDTRELVASVLSSAGFLVRTASNGLEALIAAYEMGPSVIVMDVAMPLLDGIEATRLIKAIRHLREAPVIAYTARTPLKEQQLFAAVLEKPADPAVVVATVRRLAGAAA
jgi:CheY-like chemotaxis protein